ncbi:MAG: hypothetical protein SGPRY_012974 [Prymnesium sp.]
MSERNPSFGALPAQLVIGLQGNYSTTLYGAESKIDVLHMRVIWPSLLPLQARVALAGAVQCQGMGCVHHSSRCQNDTRLFIQHLGDNFLNANALWVHQPAWRLPSPPASNEWAELSHCFYSNFVEHVHPSSPMWLFHAPGSGLWANVGRTLNIGAAKGVDHSLLGHFHKALILGFRGRIEPLLEELRNRSSAADVLTFDEYDSMQFPLYSAGRNWGGQQFTEITLHSG